MKRKIALVIISLILLMSVNAVAAVTDDRGYSFVDDNASITTNITVKEDVATLDVYVSGGIYAFTGLSFGYEYDASALTLLNTDKVIKGNSKLDIGGKWLESFSAKAGQIRYFIASTSEFATYKNGETEKLFSLEFKINTPNGEATISYLESANVINCGDTNIYLHPKKITAKQLDGSEIFKLAKNFIPEKIEITEKTYSDINTIYMAAGKTAQLYVKTKMPTDYMWSGTGETANVSETGLLTALATGKSTVIVTDAFGNTDEIEVVVQAENLWPKEIEIVCPDTIMVGDMIRPSYKMYPNNVTATSLIWSIEGENVSILTADPVLWALSEGKFLLRASLESDVSVYTEKYIDIVAAPKSSEKVVAGSFLVPEKLYVKPGAKTTFDITPKLFNIAGAPIAKDVYSAIYDIEYKTPETKGISFDKGILTVSPDAPAVTEMTISAVVKYKLDGKAVTTLESNKFCIYNSKLMDVSIEDARFEDGVYKVKSDDFEIVPFADGKIYSIELKNGDVTDVYFFSSDKKGVLGYNFDYMIKHIRIQVEK